LEWLVEKKNFNEKSGQKKVDNDAQHVSCFFICSRLVAFSLAPAAAAAAG
jgi:hypothetical protein